MRNAAGSGKVKAQGVLMDMVRHALADLSAPAEAD
jgi:hypothetical protein